MQHQQNSADYIQTVISQLDNHPFVQHLVPLKGKPPGFVLYVADQLNDIVQFFSADARYPSIMGIDRTFNLGECYVTCTVYKNNRVLRKTSQEPPIMLGPVYLHWDGCYESYHGFFSHLQCKFDSITLAGMEVGIKDLLVGSDEERPLTKAIQRCFPDSTMLLCTCHLEDNTRRRLQNKVGVDKKTQKLVLQDLFGPDGLSSANDTFQFEEIAHTLQSKYEESVPLFTRYLRQKLLPAIREHVVAPRIQHENIPINWTNNNCEAINHLLKLETNWKPEKVPDLIEKIYRIVQLQYADIRQALHGQGNLQLAPHVQHLQVAHINWTAKTEDEKNKLSRTSCPTGVGNDLLR